MVMLPLAGHVPARPLLLTEELVKRIFAQGSKTPLILKETSLIAGPQADFRVNRLIKRHRCPVESVVAHLQNIALQDIRSIPFCHVITQDRIAITGKQNRFSGNGDLPRTAGIVSPVNGIRKIIFRCIKNLNLCARNLRSLPGVQDPAIQRWGKPHERQPEIGLQMPTFPL